MVRSVKCVSSSMPYPRRPVFSAASSVVLREQIRLVRLDIARLADDEIDLGHFEAGDGHVEIWLNREFLQF